MLGLVEDGVLPLRADNLRARACMYGGLFFLLQYLLPF